MKKILFLIHDLGQGGAEKVLVNLVNNMDRSKFDISLIALFGGGVNEQFLKPHIRYRAIFPRAIPGNSKLQRLFTPEFLHRMFIKEKYDIEVAYLEGMTARIISGCKNPDTKLVCWIHSTFATQVEGASCFRNMDEARTYYGRFDSVVGVSASVQQSFKRIFPQASRVEVLYNTVESEKILNQSKQTAEKLLDDCGQIRLISVGSLKQVKGYERLIRIHSRLCEDGYNVHTYLLGRGPDREKLEQLAIDCGQTETITFLGFDSNPYKYVAKSHLFVCSSYSEGFSTAATEALIVGTPVCTVEVSGMKEMLGENNEWGIVTENDEDALYQGIKRLLDNPALLAHYKEKAIERGKSFSTENTVKAVENMLLSL